jgi:hypothetical protein
VIIPLSPLPMTSATQVFSIPELLNLIYKNASPRGHCYLLYTNRRGFDTAIGLAWNDVDGIIHLLKLIPGVAFWPHDSEHPSQVVRLSVSIFPRLLNQFIVDFPM